jgi:hypothetical protein
VRKMDRRFKPEPASRELRFGPVKDGQEGNAARREVQDALQDLSRGFKLGKGRSAREKCSTTIDRFVSGRFRTVLVEVCAAYISTVCFARFSSRRWAVSIDREPCWPVFTALTSSVEAAEVCEYLGSPSPDTRRRKPHPRRRHTNTCRFIT